MTIGEFSNQFDTLANSYAQRINQGDQSYPNIAFDEYEKSVFLTQSQEAMVTSLYNGKNAYGDSFESTEEMRRYLSNLVVDVTLDPIENTAGVVYGVDSTSKFFTLPDDVWYITYEAANTTISGGKCDGKEKMLDVIPITQDKYHRVKRNPFRGANSRRALRLDLADGVIEIVCNNPINSYYVRYLRKPKPIILVNLSEIGDLSIGGETTPSGCELHEALHQKILEGAVRYALQTRGIQIQENNNR